MGKGLVTETSLAAIADSIRAKNGESTKYKPSDMATAIDNLPSGGAAPSNAAVLNAKTNFNDNQAGDFANLRISGQYINNGSIYKQSTSLSSKPYILTGEKNYRYGDPAPIMSATTTSGRFVVTNRAMWLNGSTFYPPISLTSNLSVIFYGSTAIIQRGNFYKKLTLSELPNGTRAIMRLDEQRVLLQYNTGSSANGYTPYFMVATINTDDTITLGTAVAAPIMKNSTYYNYAYARCGDNIVLFKYQAFSDSVTSRSIVPLTISGSNIAIGTSTAITVSQYDTSRKSQAIGTSATSFAFVDTGAVSSGTISSGVITMGTAYSIFTGFNSECSGGVAPTSSDIFLLQSSTDGARGYAIKIVNSVPTINDQLPLANSYNKGSIYGLGNFVYISSDKAAAPKLKVGFDTTNYKFTTTEVLYNQELHIDRPKIIPVSGSSDTFLYFRARWNNDTTAFVSLCGLDSYPNNGIIKFFSPQSLTNINSANDNEVPVSLSLIGTDRILMAATTKTNNEVRVGLFNRDTLELLNQGAAITKGKQSSLDCPLVYINSNLAMVGYYSGARLLSIQNDTISVGEAAQLSFSGGSVTALPSGKIATATQTKLGVYSVDSNQILARELDLPTITTSSNAIVSEYDDDKLVVYRNRGSGSSAVNSQFNMVDLTGNNLSILWTNTMPNIDATDISFFVKFGSAGGYLLASKTGTFCYARITSSGVDKIATSLPCYSSTMGISTDMSEIYLSESNVATYLSGRNDSGIYSTTLDNLLVYKPSANNKYSPNVITKTPGTTKVAGEYYAYSGS